MKFFSVTHNSFAIKGYPWVNHVVSGLVQGTECDVCGVEQLLASGNIEVTLAPRKGTRWPDILGCGSYPFFIVSDRVLDSWCSEIVSGFSYHKVSITGSIPPKLLNHNIPTYWWLDGQKMQGSLLDFERSGYVGVEICSKCGHISYDINATYVCQHSLKFPFVLVKHSWNGSDIFTTNLSSTQFFCTEKVLNLAKKYRLTNFRFLSIEEGLSVEGNGIDYLAD